MDGWSANTALAHSIARVKLHSWRKTARRGRQTSDATVASAEKTECSDTVIERHDDDVPEHSQRLAVVDPQRVRPAEEPAAVDPHLTRRKETVYFQLRQIKSTYLDLSRAVKISTYLLTYLLQSIINTVTTSASKRLAIGQFRRQVETPHFVRICCGGNSKQVNNSLRQTPPELRHQSFYYVYF